MGCEGKRLKEELGGCLRERDAVRMVSDDAMEKLGGRTGGKSDATWPCGVGRGGWRGWVESSHSSFIFQVPFP